LVLVQKIGVRVPARQPRTSRCMACHESGLLCNDAVRRGCTEWYVLHASMKFYYVYILESVMKNFMYVGFTENLKRRFKEHNNKEEKSTKHYAPFTLIHYEAYLNKKDAERRELYLKTTKGKTTLRYMLREYFSEH
jgi:putative endonuclease